MQPASVPDSEFFAVVKAELVRKNPIPFPELIRAVMSATGLKQARVRYRILQCPHLDVQERQGLRCKSVSCKDIDFEFGRVGEVRELLRDKVQVEIRSILCESPNVPMKKGDLYKAVLRNVSCLRPTFYHYLEEMSDIRSFRQGNEHYAVYEHKEEVERIEIRLDGYNIGHGLESELERALNRLTLEEVDIGLFELGRIFENCLRAYLSCAHENSVINVRRKDTDSLANMINCVVREGVVTKGHHLDTLREERNSRAHGETPSAEEQKSLFNKAHYIADLFVKYIVFLDEKRAEIEV